MIPARGDVAIVGMACIFPGAPDLGAYWENILAKVDAVSDPPEGWGAELYFDPDSPETDRVYCKRGGYLKELASFDPFKYGVMPASIDGGEPDQFLALRVAHEALADAGYLDRPLERKNVEVILGRTTAINRGNANTLQHGLVLEQTLHVLKRLHPEYTPERLRAVKEELRRSLPPFNAEITPSLVPNLASGRIANRLDLMGPNYIVDAACASSLIAVELGMQDLLAGKCDMAIAGGVHASTPHLLVMGFCQLKALSRRGEIRPFDAGADGTLLGEGVGIVVLKRREDAERDGDRIYALLRAVGTASDGRALGLLAPRLEGEVLALERAYARSGVAPGSIGLIEAHGTATAVGDVTEIQALRRVFGPRQGAHPTCALGTVKSMISHCIPAAGIAGLIKTALALYHKVLPPTIHCEHPNPKLELETTPFYLNTETRPWIHAGPEPRRAGVNAFGFGGINAHAILEECPAGDEAVRPGLMHRWDSEVCILRGETRQELLRRGRDLLRLLARRPVPTLKDLAFTLNCPLPEGGLRLAIVAGTAAELEAKLTHALDRLADPRCAALRDRSGIYFAERPLAREGGLGFLFPGEGSQYPRMLADLCLHFPEVRACFDRADAVFLRNGRAIRPSQVVFPPPAPGGGDGLWQLDLAVALVLTADEALLRLLQRLEIRPEALAGHSSGEYVALVASGAADLRDEAALLRAGMEFNRIYEVMTGLIPPADLLTVGAADPAAVAAAIAESRGALALAMDNCPHQVVLCGDPDEIARARDRLQAQGALCGVLPFARAYHTERFRPACEPLQAFFRDLPIVAPRTTLYSCATAQPYPGDPGEIRALAVEQWARPVRFRETVEAMYAAGVRLFVEVGPRGNLTGFVEDILQARPACAIPANLPTRSGLAQLHHLIGQLAAHGVAMRLDHLYARRMPRRLDLDPGAPPGDGAGRRPAPMRLALELPRLDLRAGGTGAGRPAPAPETQRPGPVPPAGPTPGDAPGRAAPAHRDAPGPGQSLRGPGGRARVVEEHLRTMERFLDLQREAMAAFAGRRRGRPLPAGPARAAAAAGDPVGPFRLRIRALTPGSALRASCELSVAEHPFLRDHTLGRSASVLDPTLIGLPVLPLTVSLEIMAQAASLLAGGGVLIGLREVRAQGWIPVEAERLDLELAARLLRPGEIAVRLQAGPAGGDGGRAGVEGTLLFAAAHPPAPAPRIGRPRDARPFAIARERFYRDFMFHGPRFQSVTSVESSGEDGIEATLAALPLDTLFAGGGNPALVLDPVLLDGAQQVPGFWTWERLESGFVIFPVGLDALWLFGPWPAPPGTLACRARVGVPDAGRVRADLELSGPDGRLLARIAGWEYTRLPWSREVCRFGFTPGEVLLSQPWPAAPAGLPAPHRLVGRRFGARGDAIFIRALAHFSLTRRERQAWQGLGGPERRRLQWLAGRVAAKDAVRAFLRERLGVALCPADIEIVADGHGRPGLAEECMRRLGCRVVLSIAHAGDLAVAVAGEAGPQAGVGIDVEPLDRRTEGLEEIALDADEIRLLDGAPPAARGEWRLRLWCAKEAVAKALGCGLLGGPAGLRVRALDAGSGRVTLALAGEMAARFPERAGEPFAAFTGRDEDAVFAAALA